MDNFTTRTSTEQEYSLRFSGAQLFFLSAFGRAVWAVRLRPVFQAIPAALQVSPGLLCRLAVVALEQPTEPLAAEDPPLVGGSWAGSMIRRLPLRPPGYEWDQPLSGSPCYSATYGAAVI